jgi:flagella basal body P-ring formation protein FlgA
MACFADRRVLFFSAAFVATLWTALAALVTYVDATAPRTNFDARAAAAVAERWGVASERVHIQWIDTLPRTAAGDVTLRGTGVQGQWTLDVRDSHGTLYRARLRAGTRVSIARAAYDLPRGATVTAADIILADTIAWGPPPRERPASVEGWTTRRLVTAGEPLVAPAVAAPLWVRAGDDVRVVVVRGSLELTLTGRAAGSAAAGERVAVRADTGRRLTGTVTAPGVVRVDSGKDL